MNFEWDAHKRETNITKHGIYFELAIEVFGDDNALFFEDTRKDYGEKRYVIIGKATELLVLTVVYTGRGKVIRIISARRASKKERNMYYDNSIQ